MRWSVAAAIVLAARAGAQIPRTFENLRVLPKDVSRDSLLSVMNVFTNGLGVQCGYCHAGGNPATLVGVDFSSDDKRTKVRAREMYTMTARINDLMRADSTGRAAPLRVDCFTCHRGSPDPRPLEAVLASTIERSGVDSALQQYRDLRRQLLDRGRFDFGEASLNTLGTSLARQGRNADAIRVLELNKEFHPDLPTLNFNLAELYLARGTRGDSALALQLYELVVAKQPLNGRAKARVDALRGVKPRGSTSPRH